MRVIGGEGKLSERIGPYRLVQRIGEGGMGVVHLGLDPENRTVAVKVLRPHVTSDATARRRLAREVETMRRVHNPHVAEIVDADVTGDNPYIVTQYVPGHPLDSAVDERGSVRGAELRKLTTGLASALAAIHAAGIIHRDLKPANVMLVNGAPIVIDFGIAQAVDTTRLTQTGMFIGTPGYLAPEVIQGGEVGPAADIHALASTLIFAATGHPPFGSGGFELIFFKILQGQPDLTGVPTPLVPVLSRALSRDPNERPDAAELVRQFGGMDLRDDTPLYGPGAPGADGAAHAAPADPGGSSGGAGAAVLGGLAGGAAGLAAGAALGGLAGGAANGAGAMGAGAGAAAAGLPGAPGPVHPNATPGTPGPGNPSGAAGDATPAAPGHPGTPGGANSGPAGGGPAGGAPMTGAAGGPSGGAAAGGPAGGAMGGAAGSGPAGAPMGGAAGGGPAGGAMGGAAGSGVAGSGPAGGGSAYPGGPGAGDGLAGAGNQAAGPMNAAGPAPGYAPGQPGAAGMGAPGAPGTAASGTAGTGAPGTGAPGAGAPGTGAPGPPGAAGAGAPGAGAGVAGAGAAGAAATGSAGPAMGAAPLGGPGSMVGDARTAHIPQPPGGAGSTAPPSEPGPEAELPTNPNGRTLSGDGGTRPYTRQAGYDDFGDVLKPVEYAPPPAPAPRPVPPPGPPQAPVASVPPGGYPQDPRQAPPGWDPYADPRRQQPPAEKRSPGWHPLLSLACGVTAVAATVLLPTIFICVVLIALVLLRAVDHASSKLAVRRSARGPKGSDPLIVALGTPWGLVRGALVQLLMVLLPAVVAAVVFGVLVYLKPGVHTDTLAAYAAGAFTLMSVIGPGSGSPRRGLNRTIGVFARGGASTVVVGLVLTLVALFTAVGAATQNPSWEPVNVTHKTPNALVHQGREAARDSATGFVQQVVKRVLRRTFGG